MDEGNNLNELWTDQKFTKALGSRLLEMADEAVFYTDASLRFRGANRAFYHRTGIYSDQLLGADIGILGIDSSGRNLSETLNAELRGQSYWSGEIRRRAADGTIKTERLRLSPVDAGDGILGYAGILTDVSDLRSVEAKLEYSTSHDSLTDLSNREYFNTALDERAKHCALEGGTIAVCVLDLDDFKRINNDLSRETGDQILKAVAKRLQETLRGGDLLARTGGDEFSLAISLSSGEPRAIAERLLQAFDAPFVAGGRPVYCNATIGMALCPEHGYTSARLTSCADLALQSRKIGSKAAYAIYRDDLALELQGKSSLVTDLRSVLDAGRSPAGTCPNLGTFAVYYQPLVSMSTGRLVGVEALSRWTHPEKGLIPPNRFIPLAEESGLIVELGTLVLHQACDTARAWLKRRGNLPFMMSVNVSARQLEDPSFITEAAAAAEGLPPGTLVLEITESQLVADMAATVKLLNILKEKGFTLSVDDFGTGYASLAYLKMLPVDIVKIDQSFISDLFHDRQDRRIVEAVTALSKSLGAQTIAEGVETPAQFELLKEMGCDYVQGFLMSKALPAAALPPLMQGRYDASGRFAEDMAAEA